MCILDICISIAGILAVIWPCSIICAVSELFQSESLTQVYEILHELLNQNIVKMDSLSKYYNTIIGRHLGQASFLAISGV